MSYILEALKKAQAERQLGSAPSIHTLPIATATAGHAARERMPWLLAGGGLLLALVVAVMWWRQRPAPVVQTAPAVVVAAAPAPAVVAAPAPATIVVPPSPKPLPAAAPARPAHVSPSYVPPIPPAVKPPSARVAPAPVAPPPPAPAPAALEENLPTMAQLPADVQGQLPRITFGGYMYSPNPADRLLLIDKVLRREGEEVAPGLVLEQLQPRAAVMNYRGTRYRVAY